MSEKKDGEGKASDQGFDCYLIVTRHNHGIHEPCPLNSEEVYLAPDYEQTVKCASAGYTPQYAKNYNSLDWGN